MSLLATGLVIVSSQASARFNNFHGSSCQAASSGSTCLKCDQYGVQNTCSTAQNIICSMPMDPLNNSIVADMGYFSAYDRSATADVSCTLVKVNDAGVPQWSQTLSTSGGGPGSGMQDRYFNIPSILVSTGTWCMQCTLPGVNSGAISYLVGTSITTNE